ncbi:MAG: DUF962 domain-containing protein, partial [Anaerolineae bacterium]|nr:DUF962 domain-containing protein [Anaerolineae bacterium]
EQIVATYRRDHRHPVNHFLHVGVGWPMVAAALLVLPFRPWWSLGLFVGGYAFMWMGHFVFERNLPTIWKYPATPLVMAVAVVKSMGAGLGRLLGGRQGRV